MPKTYTTVPDKATGDVFTEAMWDTYIKDNINNLIVPPACRVYHSANQSIPNNAATTLSLNSEDFDTDSMHDTVTNNSRITINTTGIYVITLNVLWGTSTAGDRTAQIWLNGADYIAGDTRPAPDNSSYNGEQSVSVVRAFTAGDYVEARVTQDSGGGLNVLVQNNRSPYFSAAWIGRTS